VADTEDVTTPRSEPDISDDVNVEKLSHTEFEGGGGVFDAKVGPIINILISSNIFFILLYVHNIK